MYNEYHRPLMLKTVRDSLAKVNDMEYAALCMHPLCFFDATYKDVKERLAIIYSRGSKFIFWTNT